MASNLYSHVQMIVRNKALMHTTEVDWKVRKLQQNSSYEERRERCQKTKTRQSERVIEQQQRKISDLQQEPLVPDHSACVPVDDLREGKFPTIT